MPAKIMLGYVLSLDDELYEALKKSDFEKAKEIIDCADHILVQKYKKTETTKCGSKL